MYIPSGSDKPGGAEKRELAGWGLWEDRKTEEKLYIIPPCNQRVNYMGRRLCAKVPQNLLAVLKIK